MARAPGPLPYRWHPAGTKFRHHLNVGDYLAWRHVAWRVIEARTIPVEEWADEDREAVAHLVDALASGPRIVVIRPAQYGDDVRDRDHDVHLRVPARYYAGWEVYPDRHYPVCVVCAEPSPCREVMAERLGAAAVERMARYEMPGVCPSCQEPITSRQKSIEFPGPNAESPTAEGAAFHLRAQCWWAAKTYEEKWVAAAPGRPWRLVCQGKIRRHVDGWDCTEGAACPDDNAFHWDRSRCTDSSVRCTRCDDARARGDIHRDKPPTPRRRRRAAKEPAGPTGYVVPAARIGAQVHIADPDRPEYPKPVSIPGRAVVPQFPAGTVLGHTVCGLEMQVEDSWVGYRADPTVDGSLCAGCATAQGITRGEQIA